MADDLVYQAPLHTATRREAKGPERVRGPRALGIKVRATGVDTSPNPQDMRCLAALLPSLSAGWDELPTSDEPAFLGECHPHKPRIWPEARKIPGPTLCLAGLHSVVRIPSSPSSAVGVSKLETR